MAEKLAEKYSCEENVRKNENSGRGYWKSQEQGWKGERKILKNVKESMLLWKQMDLFVKWR